jgi:hypothetical protein
MSSEFTELFPKRAFISGTRPTCCYGHRVLNSHRVEENRHPADPHFYCHVVSGSGTSQRVLDLCDGHDATLSRR